jgi:hypothetical protein
MEVAKYQDISFGMKSRLQRVYKTPILAIPRSDGCRGMVTCSKDDVENR